MRDFSCIFHEAMIYLSKQASEKIHSLKKEDSSRKDHLLRVRVKKGGCSGFSYHLDFTSEVQEADKVLEEQGHKLVIDSESFLYILGMTLDYEGGLNGKGFVFINPNAKDSCGCGSSFSV